MRNTSPMPFISVNKYDAEMQAKIIKRLYLAMLKEIVDLCSKSGINFELDYSERSIVRHFYDAHGSRRFSIQFPTELALRDTVPLPDGPLVDVVCRPRIAVKDVTPTQHLPNDYVGYGLHLLLGAMTWSAGVDSDTDYLGSTIKRLVLGFLGDRLDLVSLYPNRFLGHINRQPDDSSKPEVVITFQHYNGIMVEFTIW